MNDLTGEMDVSELLEFFLNSRDSGDAGKLAYIFHYALADAVRKRCIRLREKYGISTVCLSGGVFANRLLLTMCEKFLSDLDFVVYYNSILPTNDGGISAGQIYLADLRQY
jgi:hydrogenase maturation protein HypF